MMKHHNYISHSQTAQRICSTKGISSFFDDMEEKKIFKKPADSDILAVHDSFIPVYLYTCIPVYLYTLCAR